MLIIIINNNNNATNTVVKPECMYASECLVLNCRLDRLEVLERRIIRKILGPVKTTEVWKLRSNDEIYRNIESITKSIRKRRLLFFGHIYRLNDSRLTKRIFKYLWEKKSSTNWIQEVKKDLERNNIREQETMDRDTFRKKVLSMEGFRGGLERKPGVKWSEERKKQHSDRMKEVWKRKREKHRVKN